MVTASSAQICLSASLWSRHTNSKSRSCIKQEVGRFSMQGFSICLLNFFSCHTHPAWFCGKCTCYTVCPYVPPRGIILRYFHKDCRSIHDSSSDLIQAAITECRVAVAIRGFWMWSTEVSICVLQHSPFQEHIKQNKFPRQTLALPEDDRKQTESM